MNVKYAKPPKKYGNEIKSINVYQPIEKQRRDSEKRLEYTEEDDELAELEAMMM